VSKRTKWLLGIGAIATLLFGLQVAAYALSLPGSNFEIDNNANLKVDGAAPPALDWANVAEERQADEPTGSADDSFGNGTKEDTAVPSVVDGSIPPNKSDLLNFGVYFEENANAAGEDFLNVFWHRVQEPSGTTNMDFEFNQSNQISGNGVTPVRTAGDVLIQYDLSQGGVVPVLFISRWVTTGATSQCEGTNKLPCWSTKQNLSAAGDATGSINSTPILAADSDGLGPISARTFGEAQINFAALTGGQTDDCVGFGSAYLKSRSSDSFTAALKDFIKPRTVDLNQCGTVKVIKNDDATPGTPLDDAEFDLVKDEAPIGGSPGVEDDEVVDSCVTVAGECEFGDVLQGDYWVIETVAPPGHDLADPAFQHVTVAAEGTETVTFVNPAQKGAIQVTKSAKHAGAGSPNLEAEFAVMQGLNPIGTITTDPLTGIGCLDDLPLGTYTVTETSAAAGYALDTSEEEAIVGKGTCASGAAEVSFENTPLTNVTVSVDSQVEGGTASVISCDDGTSGTTGANGDGSVEVNDLEPTDPDVTLTCEITVDP
jgi:Prealbumin-like fold domain